MTAYSIFSYLALFLLVPNACCSRPDRKVLNASDSYQSDWTSTTATYYGAVDGAGTLGGACGYEAAVQSTPYNSRVAAVGSSLFDKANGCGLCYLITCSYPFCSGASVNVVATDLCPDGACSAEHLFDLSGASIEDLARPGEEDQLRALGTIRVQYKSVPCEFRGVDVTFRVDPGSGGEYFATAVEFENGGEIVGVDVKDANSSDWVPMTRLWGAVFKVLFDHPYAAPLSFRLSDASQTIEAFNVVPENYKKDVPYTSTVNFNG